MFFKLAVPIVCAILANCITMSQVTVAPVGSQLAVRASV